MPQDRQMGLWCNKYYKLQSSHRWNWWFWIMNMYIYIHEQTPRIGCNVKQRSLASVGNDHNYPQGMIVVIIRSVDISIYPVPRSKSWLKRPSGRIHEARRCDGKMSSFSSEVYKKLGSLFPAPTWICHIRNDERWLWERNMFGSSSWKYQLVARVWSRSFQILFQESIWTSAPTVSQRCPHGRLAPEVLTDISHFPHICMFSPGLLAKSPVQKTPSGNLHKWHRWGHSAHLIPPHRGSDAAGAAVRMFDPAGAFLVIPDGCQV